MKNYYLETVFTNEVKNLLSLTIKPFICWTDKIGIPKNNTFSSSNPLRLNDPKKLMRLIISELKRNAIHSLWGFPMSFFVEVYIKSIQLTTWRLFYYHGRKLFKFIIIFKVVTRCLWVSCQKKFFTSIEKIMKFSSLKKSFCIDVPSQCKLVSLICSSFVSWKFNF